MEGVRHQNIAYDSGGVNDNGEIMWRNNIISWRINGEIMRRIAIVAAQNMYNFSLIV